MRSLDMQAPKNIDVRVDFLDLDPALQKQVEDMMLYGNLDDSHIQIDFPEGSLFIDKYSCLPVEGHNGNWSGERGNSEWHFSMEYIPKKSNPENQTWEEILAEYDIDNVKFENCELNLKDISKGEVEIKDFSKNRSDNFDKADIALAEKRDCTPEEDAKWRKENGYTWHEMSDMKTMQKVPSKIHNNISHSGGISAAKKMEA